MPPSLQPAPETISQIVNLLREKRFDEAVEVSKTMTDYPQVCVLHCFAHMGGGKLFKANSVIKDLIEAINSNRLFGRLAAEAGFNCDDIYARSAPHDLGFLMWAAIESGSLSAGPEPEALLPYKMQLLHPSKGLSPLQQQNIMQELVAFDPGPEKLLQLAGTPVPGNTYKYGPSLTAFIIGTLTKLAEIENKPSNVAALMSAITLLMRIGPAGSELADQLLSKVFLIAPMEKMIIVSTYLDLAKLNKDNLQEKYIYQALNLVDGLPEFIGDKELTLEMKWRRLIHYYDYYTKMEWYRSNEGFELAEVLFFEQPLPTSFAALLQLTNTSNLNDPNTRLFLEGLYGSLVKIGRHHVEPLLPVIIGSRQKWMQEPLLQFLLLVDNRAGAGYIKEFVEHYQKQQQELLRQQQLVNRMKSENFERDPSIGGFLSDFGVDRRLERVLLGVSAPQSVQKATGFTARFVAYEEWMEQLVKEKILQMSQRSKTNLGIKKCYWQRGTEITVCLGEHITVDNPEEKFTWDGEMNIVDFDVRVSG
ncbi:MAG: hypothetical protein H0X70_06215 [Segetibacter sp.]|nr:hypothetical protein [Segetibacter sp.]